MIPAYLELARRIQQEVNDLEQDDAAFRFMQPAVSRAYLLAAGRIATQVTEQSLARQTVMLEAIQGGI